MLAKLQSSPVQFTFSDSTPCIHAEQKPYLHTLDPIHYITGIVQYGNVGKVNYFTVLNVPQRRAVSTVCTVEHVSIQFVLVQSGGCEKGEVVCTLPWNVLYILYSVFDLLI